MMSDDPAAASPIKVYDIRIGTANCFGFGFIIKESPTLRHSGSFFSE